MEKFALNRATHFSIVWGVTLAVATLMEWNSLDRDPVKHEILSPFIERHIAISVAKHADSNGGDILDSIGQESPAAGEEPIPEAALRYDVEIAFNGPLFLACFFTPVLVFQGVGLLWRRLRRERH